MVCDCYEKILSAWCIFNCIFFALLIIFPDRRKIPILLAHKGEPNFLLYIWGLSSFPQTCFWLHTLQILLLTHQSQMSSARCYGTQLDRKATSGLAASRCDVQRAGKVGVRIISLETTSPPRRLAIHWLYMGRLVVSNHMNLSHYIQTKFILTQFPLSQILKVLVAFQAPSDVRFRVREMAVERDGNQCDWNLLLPMLQRRTASEHIAGPSVDFRRSRANGGSSL